MATPNLNYLSTLATSFNSTSNYTTSTMSTTDGTTDLDNFLIYNISDERYLYRENRALPAIPDARKLAYRFGTNLRKFLKSSVPPMVSYRSGLKANELQREALLSYPDEVEYRVFNPEAEVWLGKFLEEIEYLDLGHILKGKKFALKMVDGSMLQIDEKGNYFLEDQYQTRIYEANNRREFNRYINASDVMEQFITYLQDKGVKQVDFLNLPIEVFINFMIIQAAQKDGDPIPSDIVPPEIHPKLIESSKQEIPRCKYCGKFIEHKREKAGVKFCGEGHLFLFMNRDNNYGKTIQRR
jgi:hypothetical protein